MVYMFLDLWHSVVDEYTCMRCQSDQDSMSCLLKKENVLENRAEVFRREGANGGNTKAKLIAKEELNNQLKLELRKKVVILDFINLSNIFSHSADSVRKR